ncbi:hypothetical protein [Spirosoma arcticum]
MEKPKSEPDKQPRKRKENYDKKPKIKSSLFDVLKVAVSPKPDENVKADK